MVVLMVVLWMDNGFMVVLWCFYGWRMRMMGNENDNDSWIIGDFSILVDDFCGSLLGCVMIWIWHNWDSTHFWDRKHATLR